MQTPLDQAQAAMQTAPDDDAARLRFFERLADCELFLLLAAGGETTSAAAAAGAAAEGEAGGETESAALTPAIFPADGARYVLAFDREDRLAGFAGGPAPYAALSGRALAAMLRGKGLGLGLNLGAPSETLLPAAALDWLADTLAPGPQEALARAEAFHAPAGLPEPLVAALATKLALAEGLARLAYLAGVRYEGGARGHLLAVIDALPGAEPALSRAVSEALVFSGIEAGALDVVFLAASDPASARLARLGLRFDIPVPPEPPPESPAPAPPGSNPARPPRLR